jgi:hypothetical protein
VHPNALRSKLWAARLESSNGEVVYKPLVEQFLRVLDWRKTLGLTVWPRLDVYVLGNPSIKGHVMQITEVMRVPDTIARSAPLSSGILLMVYSDHVADGKCTWQVDYDKVWDYMYVLLSSHLVTY